MKLRIAGMPDWRQRQAQAALLAQEAMADLAFALHVDQNAESGKVLIEKLAALRRSQAQRDPGHDTHAALQCYLAQRDRLPASESRSLDAWQERCVAQLFWPS